jgi:serine/threonine-protein kinase
MAMKNTNLQPDLLFCRQCRRHFRGKRRECPTDGQPLELVTPFAGEAGDILDERYELKQTIGVGGMGTVFRAYDRLTQRDVALKLLRAEYASNASSAQRFLSEAKLLRLIRHPSVVGLHRFSRTENGTLLIDMELLDGESVRDRVLRQGCGFDFASAMSVLDQLLAALGTCHEAGVIHCDIKPENLMLPRSGGVAPMKLVDFGVAQAPGPVHQSDDVGVIGTPAYMSPEQVRAGNVDGRTDLYLVGCVAYELLTGEPPFTQQSPIDLCHAQMLQKPPALDSRTLVEPIPPGFEAWLMPLLEKDPQMRPAGARQAREQLRVIRHAHRRQLAEATHRPVRPPSAALLRRPMPAAMVRGPAHHSGLPVRSDGSVEAVRALIEVRQLQSHTGVAYGPEAIEQIARHVLAGSIEELREVGASVQGPAGPHIEVFLPCGGDERGVVSHLLDVLASMQGHLSRIPEPRLEMRAAVVADIPAIGVPYGTGLDPLDLMHVSPLTQVRVDEHVAKWAGRRALVRLASLPTAHSDKPTVIYATSLQAV